MKKLLEKNSKELFAKWSAGDANIECLHELQYMKPFPWNIRNIRLRGNKLKLYPVSLHSSDSSEGRTWPRSSHVRLKWYLEDLKRFKVENCLFKVPVNRLCAESSFFSDLLSFPQPEGAIHVEGNSDENPIILSETSSQTFSNVLDWLYPEPASESRTKEVWLDLLQFADKFDMPRLHKDATMNLEAKILDPYEKIRLWERFRLDESWISDPMSKLVNSWLKLRPHDPTNPPFSLETRLMILELREAIYRENITHGNTGREIGNQDKKTMFCKFCDKDVEKTNEDSCPTCNWMNILAVDALPKIRLMVEAKIRETK
ncbi:hypothetical protein DL96DRAFT_1681370 [Flagelloscypha sp. PMI_526]|nr:hypothetical protein DL96DRAFT_1681370 [Flagelloscypha sp. PMI_526]